MSPRHVYVLFLLEAHITVIQAHIPTEAGGTQARRGQRLTPELRHFPAPITLPESRSGPDWRSPEHLASSCLEHSRTPDFGAPSTTELPWLEGGTSESRPQAGRPPHLSRLSSSSLRAFQDCSSSPSSSWTTAAPSREDVSIASRP